MAELLVPIAYDVVKFGIGFFGSNKAAIEEANTVEEAMAFDLEDNRKKLEAEKMAGELAGKSITEAYNLSLTSNLAAQEANRRRTNVEAVNTGQEGLAAEGAMAAQLAGSGVRNTGTARNLRTETGRLYDVNIDEIDRQLAEEEAAYGLEREQAALRFEEAGESITGRDLTFEGGKLFDNGGTVDFGETVLTEKIGRELDWLQEESDEWYGILDDGTTAYRTGRDKFILDYKLQTGLSWI